MKKCLYCGADLDSENVVDFCRTCGIKAFGLKMFNAIVQNMENERSKGDLTNQESSEKNEA